MKMYGWNLFDSYLDKPEYPCNTCSPYALDFIPFYSFDWFSWPMVDFQVSTLNDCVG